MTIHITPVRLCCSAELRKPTQKTPVTPASISLSTADFDLFLVRPGRDDIVLNTSREIADYGIKKRVSELGGLAGGRRGGGREEVEGGEENFYADCTISLSLPPFLFSGRAPVSPQDLAHHHLRGPGWWRPEEHRGESLLKR